MKLKLLRPFPLEAKKLLVVENKAAEPSFPSPDEAAFVAMLLPIGNLIMILSYYIRLIRRMRMTTLQMLSPATV